MSHWPSPGKPEKMQLLLVSLVVDSWDTNKQTRGLVGDCTNKVPHWTDALLGVKLQTSKLGICSLQSVVFFLMKHKFPALFSASVQTQDNHCLAHAPLS